MTFQFRLKINVISISLKDNLRCIFDNHIITQMIFTEIPTLNINWLMLISFKKRQKFKHYWVYAFQFWERKALIRTTEYSIQRKCNSLCVLKEEYIRKIQWSNHRVHFVLSINLMHAFSYYVEICTLSLECSQLGTSMWQPLLLWFWLKTTLRQSQVYQVQVVVKSVKHK